MKWLLFALNNVLRNRRRSMMTISVTAIGMLSVMVAGGYGLASYEGLTEMSVRTTGHLVLATPAQFETDEEYPLEHGIDGYQPIRQQLMANERVRLTLPRIEFSGLISNGDKSVIFLGRGVAPDAEFRVSGPSLGLEQGHLLNSSVAEDAEPEVLLGVDLASSLHAEVGSSLTLLASNSEGGLNAIDVTVQGIITTGKPEMDKRIAYVTIATAQELLVSERITTLGVYLYDTPLTAGMQQHVGQQYPALMVKRWDELAFYFHKVKDLYDRLFLVMGLVIALMVFFSVTNTMTMTVMERTREIGTQAALGALPWQIIQGYVLEALIIGVIGGLLGSLLSGGVTLFLANANIMMPPPPGMTRGYPLLVNFSAHLALITALLLMVTVAIAAWVAARRGVKQPIVEALTHV